MLGCCSVWTSLDPGNQSRGTPVSPHRGSPRNTAQQRGQAAARPEACPCPWPIWGSISAYIRFASAPQQIASTPRQIASAPRQIASAPRQIASAPRQIASAPRQIASAPWQIASASRQIASAPRQFTTISVVPSYITWKRLVGKMALHGNLTIDWPTAETARTLMETCSPAIIMPQCIEFWDTISTHGISAHPRPPANALVRALSTRWSTRCQRVSKRVNKRVGRRVRNALRTRYGCTEWR